MLNRRWSGISPSGAWTSDHGPQPPQLARRDERLVELEEPEQLQAGLAGEVGGQRDDHRDREDADGDREPLLAPGPGEVPAGGALVADLLRQPPEPRRDLGPVRLRRPLLRLAVRDDRALQVARAHLGRGDVAPRRIGRGVVGQAGRLLPGRQRLPVVVQAVQRLAEADQRRAGDRDVVEADHPLVEPGGVDEICGRHQLARVVEGRHRRLA